MKICTDCGYEMCDSPCAKCGSTKVSFLTDEPLASPSIQSAGSVSLGIIESLIEIVPDVDHGQVLNFFDDTGVRQRIPVSDLRFIKG